MLHSLWCFARYVFWTLLMLPTAFVAMLVTGRTDASIWVARNWWSPFCMAQSGATMTVIGQEHVDPKRPTLYVSNHQSGLDITALFMAIPANFRFVCKKELKYIPLFGWYLWAAGYIFVDRGNGQRAVESMEEAGRKMRAGTSVLVFAEGTRSRDLRLLPFKKGAFHLAVKARVAICPVTIEGTGRISPRGSWDIRPGPVTVKIGKPILPEEYEGLLADQLLHKIRSLMIEQSLELGGLGGDPQPPRSQPSSRAAAA